VPQADIVLTHLAQSPAGGLLDGFVQWHAARTSDGMSPEEWCNTAAGVDCKDSDIFNTGSPVSYANSRSNADSGSCTEHIHEQSANASQTSNHRSALLPDPSSAPMFAVPSEQSPACPDRNGISEQVKAGGHASLIKQERQAGISAESMGDCAVLPASTGAVPASIMGQRAPMDMAEGEKHAASGEVVAGAHKPGMRVDSADGVAWQETITSKLGTGVTDVGDDSIRNRRKRRTVGDAKWKHEEESSGAGDSLSHDEVSGCKAGGSAEPDCSSRYACGLC
jgi:hypothetical protein